MTDARSTRSNLQATIDALANHLRRSVAIDDPTVRLICATRHFGDEDVARIRALLQRDAGPEVRRFILAQGVSRWHEPGVLVANEELGFEARLCVPLRSHGSLLGLLMVIDADASLTTDELVLIEQACQDIAAQMHSDLLATDSYNVGREIALRGLLGLDGLARQSALRFFDETGSLQDAEHVTVTVVEIHAPADPDARPEVALRVALEVAAGGGSKRSGFYIDDERATLLQVREHPIKATELQAQAERIKDEIYRVLGDGCSCAVGVGTCIGGAAGAWLALDRAKTAVRASQRLPELNSVALWSKLGVNAVLLQIPDGALVPSLIPEPVRALVDQDRTGKLTETARAYLDHGGSISRTAEDLYMHRTSLYYRLNQIRNITGLDLGNGQDRLILHIGLQLLDLLRGEPH